jgi:hypothetical protein
MRIVVVLVAAVFGASRAPAAAAPVDAGTPPAAPSTSPAACRGAALELDALTAACAIKGLPKPPPPPASVKVAVDVRPIKVRSGQTGTVGLTLTNVSAAPLELDLSLGCSAFEAWIYRARGTERADQDLGKGGVFNQGCRRGPTVRVTLEPNGVLRKQVAVVARVKKLKSLGHTVGLVDDRALPPGRYRARVMLPLLDPVTGEEGASKTRTLEVPLVVTK